MDFCLQLRCLGNQFPSVRYALWAIAAGERAYGHSRETSNTRKNVGPLADMVAKWKDAHVYLGADSYEIDDFLRDAKETIFCQDPSSRYWTPLFKVRMSAT